MKKIGALALLFTVSGVEASRASAMAAVNAQIEALSQTVHQATEGSMTEAEIRESISEHLASYLENARPTERDFVQLERRHKNKKHHKSHQPAHHTLAASKDIYKDLRTSSAMRLPDADFEKNAFFVSVPIDEVKAIKLKVMPTFERDIIDSVTLKAFRKVIGYDTFASILRKDRDEIKDPDDHYNITVSMMVRRIPPPRAAKTLDKWNGGEKIADKLDKGFPYDDGDNSISDAAPRYKKPAAPSAATNVGKLNGENVTKEALKNLIQDRTMPVTQELVQLEADVAGDNTNVFKLLDGNVTVGHLKNLVTDKPSPITVKLAQTSGDKDNVFKLMDSNVTKGQMKNLLTDKPAPITVKLAQTSGDKDNVFKLLDGNVTVGHLKNLVTDRPSPITVKLAQINGDKDNVFKLMDSNVTKGQMKNLLTDKPAPITVKLAQTNGDKDNVFKLMDSNVTKGQMKNLLTDKPAPITVKLAQINGDKDNVFKLMDSNVTKGQMKNLLTDKPAPITVKLAQINGDKDNVFKLMDSNVTKGQMKNLLTDKPAPITVKL